MTYVPAPLTVGQRPPVGAIGYVCGPMSGIENFNFDAFNECATSLREAGYRIINPAENFEGAHDLDWTTYLRVGVAQVCRSDFIVVLPGWQWSKGANIELTVARALRIPVVDCGTLEPVWTP